MNGSNSSVISSAEANAALILANGCNPPSAEESAKCRLSCSICGFKQNSITIPEMAQHMRQEHIFATAQEDPNVPQEATWLCSETYCRRVFTDQHELILHLRNDHRYRRMIEREHRFGTIRGFKSWKSSSENSSNAKFLFADHNQMEFSPAGGNYALFCEHSNSWQEGPVEARKSCPAYMNVEINAKTGKVRVIACTAHFYHEKRKSTPVYVVLKKQNIYLQVEHELQKKQFRCKICYAKFDDQFLAFQHRRREHPGRCLSMGTLQCADPNCNETVMTMKDLALHVNGDHNREDVALVECKFPDYASFEEWMHQMEAETMSHYKQCGSKLKPSLKNPQRRLRYFICHLSGHKHQPTNQDQPPMRAGRPTKKLGGHCTAFVNAATNLKDGTVDMHGCLAHFGHEPDIRELPLPRKTRKAVCEMLLSGMSYEEVMVAVKGQCTENDRSFHIKRYEIRNLHDKLEREYRRNLAPNNQNAKKKPADFDEEMDLFLHDDEDRYESDTGNAEETGSAQPDGLLPFSMNGSASTDGDLGVTTLGENAQQPIAQPGTPSKPTPVADCQSIKRTSAQPANIIDVEDDEEADAALSKAILQVRKRSDRITQRLFLSRDLDSALELFDWLGEFERKLLGATTETGGWRNDVPTTSSSWEKNRSVTGQAGKQLNRSPTVTVRTSAGRMCATAKPPKPPVTATSRSSFPNFSNAMQSSFTSTTPPSRGFPMILKPICRPAASANNPSGWQSLIFSKKTTTATACPRPPMPALRPQLRLMSPNKKKMISGGARPFEEDFEEVQVRVIPVDESPRRRSDRMKRQSVRLVDSPSEKRPRSNFHEDEEEIFDGDV